MEETPLYILWKRRGITQTALALQLGVSRQAVHSALLNKSGSQSLQPKLVELLKNIHKPVVPLGINRHNITEHMGPNLCYGCCQVSPCQQYHQHVKSREEPEIVWLDEKCALVWRQTHSLLGEDRPPMRKTRGKGKRTRGRK